MFMSTEELNVLLLGFYYRGRHSEADQQVYNALSALGLVGYCSRTDLSPQLSVVSAQLSIDEYEVPLIADAAGKLSFSTQKPEELAATLLEASGADALYFDGELAAGEEVEDLEESALEDSADDFGPQVIAGKRTPRSELALAAIGKGGGWKLREDSRTLLAVRIGQPVELILSRKMVPALEIIRNATGYQIRLHARTGPLNVEGSVALEYWLTLGQRAVPAVAAGSAAAKLQQELGLWLNGVESDELKELEELWPQAAQALKPLFDQRTEEAVREFIRALDLPEQMLDLVNGEPVGPEFEYLRGGMLTGLDLAVDEEIAGAKGPMKLLYRTGWSPAALITSSIGVIAAGVLVDRWMKGRGKPTTGWRRTIMFFWYSDAAYYLARGVRDALRPARSKS